MSLSLPMVPGAAPPAAPLELHDVAALQEEVRALAARARRRHPGAQLPGPRGPGRRPLRRRLARAVPAGRAPPSRGDRLLRRALHGRDRLGPLARQDRPHPRPRRRLLARRLHHPRAARAWQAKHPGAVTVMYVNTTAEVKALTDYCVHVVERRAGRRAHPARARSGHRDPLRPRHVPRRLRREDGRALAAHLGRRVPRPRRHPAVGHHGDPRRPPGRRLPHPPRVRLLDVGHGVRRLGRRRLRRASTCSRPAA